MGRALQALLAAQYHSSLPSLSSLQLDPSASVSKNLTTVALRVEDVLQVAGFLCESVDAVVSLAHGAYEAAQSDLEDLTGVSSVLVNVGN